MRRERQGVDGSSSRCDNISEGTKRLRDARHRWKLVGQRVLFGDCTRLEECDDLHRVSSDGGEEGVRDVLMRQFLAVHLSRGTKDVCVVDRTMLLQNLQCESAHRY